MKRYQFIESQREMYPLQMLCTVLNVSRSGYYAWRRRPPSARAQANAQLLPVIRQAHAASRGTYGSPRLQHALWRLGHRCGRHRLARLMRRMGLQGIPRRRFVRTTQLVAGRVGASDHLQRDFTASKPNEKWISDITYISTDEGWLYLATVLDLCSRRVVGWAMAEHMTEELVLAALQMAATQRDIPSGLIYHSDHGGQFTSKRVQDWLTQRHLTASMGSVGDCYDNAAAESFFSTLKRECVNRYHFSTRKEAKSIIFEYLEVFYNRQRLHSTLDYQSPVEYELTLI